MGVPGLAGGSLGSVGIALPATPRDRVSDEPGSAPKAAAAAGFRSEPRGGQLVTAVGERAARTVGALDRPYPARELAAGIFRLIVFCG